MANKAASIYSHDKREIATPPCGNHKPQPEASKNTLLVKPALGTVKATCYDLPSASNFQHEYGLRQFRDGVTSGDVVGGWQQHKGTGDQMPGRDFKALNAMAVVAGKKTSKEMTEFRQEHDARLKLGGDTRVTSKPYDETTTFGRTTAPSLSFNDLMSHGYRFDWAQSQVRACRLPALPYTHTPDSNLLVLLPIVTQPPIEEVMRKSKKPGQTKTSRLQAEVSKAKREELETTGAEKPLWKMQAYSNVPAKVGYLG